MKYLDFAFVVDSNDKPCRPVLNGYAGWLLRSKNAVIVNHDPLVIKRTDDYNSDSEDRKPITCKMDMGYMNIGFSVGDEDNEFLAGEVKLLKGVSDRIQARASYRRNRRGRLRYRRNKNVDYKTVHNPTYQNGNQDGWIAPSVQHKIDSHVRLVKKISSWIPIDKVIIEIASFDIQKIKAEIEGKEISGTDYQHGEMYGYENVKQYVRERDKYTCQLCGTNGIGKVLEVHHIIPRRRGGSDKPSNLICLCHNCHINKVHSNKNDNKYFRELQNRKINDTYKDSTFMNTARWLIYNAIGEIIVDTYVSFGYITKRNRELAGLPKFHYVDAACIGKFTYKTLSQTIYMVEQKRCNDRCMADFSDAKYVDTRDGKVKSGSDLSYNRKPTAKSKRSTRSEDIENNRVFRGEKVKNGVVRTINHSYCLKAGDLIQIKVGKRKGIICEVATTTKMDSDKYKIYFTYENKDVAYPSIRLSEKEYCDLKTNGECEKLKIIRTRRGMIWRRCDRLNYESEHENQYGASI